MSDQFSKTIRAYAGGANPHISISSVSEAAAHIAALPELRRQKLHWQLAQRTVEEAGNWSAGKDIAELAMRNALATDGNKVE
jgi:CheY-specific phosphatase CheX